MAVFRHLSAGFWQVDRQVLYALGWFTMDLKRSLEQPTLSSYRYRTPGRKEINETFYLNMTFDARLRWKAFMKKKLEELSIKYKRMYWLLEQKLKLSTHTALKTDIETHLVIYFWISWSRNFEARMGQKYKFCALQIKRKTRFSISSNPRIATPGRMISRLWKD